MVLVPKRLKVEALAGGADVFVQGRQRMRIAPVALVQGHVAGGGIYSQTV